MTAVQSIRYLDDLAQVAGKEVEATHIGFHLGLDGRDYTIDLSDESHQRLMDALAPFMAASRRTRPSIPTQRGPQRASSDVQERNRTIRDWATKRGLAVKERGHIPKEIVQAYEHEVNGVPREAAQEPPAPSREQEPAQIPEQPQEAAQASGGRIAALRARIAEETGVPEETLMGHSEDERPIDGRLFESNGRPVFETRADLLRAVRIWARGQGMDAPPKGRIPDRIMAAWVERHGEPAVVA